MAAGRGLHEILVPIGTIARTKSAGQLLKVAIGPHQATRRDYRRSAAAAVDVEIGRHDRLDRGRRDAELREAGHAGRGRHCRASAARPGRGSAAASGSSSRNRACSRGEPEGQRHQPALAADLREHQLHQLAEGVDARAAELIGPARGVGSSSAAHDRLGDVADIDRLEARAARRRSAAAPARYRAMRGEAVEETVLGPEHDRGPQDRRRRERGAHRRLAAPPCCGHRREAIAGRRRWPRHARGARTPCRGASRAIRPAPRRGRRRSAAAALVQDADQVDDQRRRRRRAATRLHRRGRSPRIGTIWPTLPIGLRKAAPTGSRDRDAHHASPARPAAAPHGGRRSRSRRKP